MILTPQIRSHILAELEEHPERALVLPDHCYDRDGFVPIYTLGLQTMLHRWLYEELIEPLNGRRIYNTSGVEGNVNPYLYSLHRAGYKKPGIANRNKRKCPRGHRYTPANTLVFGDGKRRCRTCRYRKPGRPPAEAGGQCSLERNSSSVPNTDPPDLHRRDRGSDTGGSTIRRLSEPR